MPDSGYLLLPCESEIECLGVSMDNNNRRFNSVLSQTIDSCSSLYKAYFRLPFICLLCWLTSFSAFSNTLLQEKLIGDLEEVASILTRDHPASSLTLGDEDFINQLTIGLRQHKLLAKSVTNQNQYNAVLNSFMLGFNDMHLSFRPTLRPTEFDWSGMVFVYDENQWLVSHSSSVWPSKLADVGDKLISCDGKSVDYWVTNTLKNSIAHQGSLAQLVRYSSWLFIGSNGLPQFQSYPEQCLFEKKGEQYSIKMNWQTESSKLIYPLVFNQPSRAQASFSIEKFNEDGYWIELGALYGEKIGQFVEDIEALHKELPSSKFIVIDVRGNLGGDTTWSDRIAASIFGKDFVNKQIISKPAESYKVSHENLVLIESQLSNAISQFGEEDSSTLYQRTMFEAMNAALEKGYEFAPPLSTHKVLEQSNQQTDSLLPPKFHGQLFILTDYGCFSSCLLMVNKFRQLGAITLGKVTNSMPRYYDMKLVQLSSGSGSIVTMTKVDMSEGERIGPFYPTVNFDGFMDDTKRLKTWFLNTVLGE